MLADLPTAPWFRRVLVAALILGIVLLTFSVLQPFIVPLIWGGFSRTSAGRCSSAWSACCATARVSLRC